MWQKVSEELPELERRVLGVICGEVFVVHRMTLGKDEWGWWDEARISVWPRERVKHWHPLPELPEQTTASEAEVEAT